MAERTSLKVADNNSISDDDPFAELTRIMGFDPRQPMGRQEVADPVMGDDFDIDLEKELMGEFSLDEEEGAASPVQQAGLADSFDDSFAPEVAHDVPAHEAHVDGTPSHEAAGADAAPDFDFAVENDASPAPAVDFDRDFDDALTRSFEAEPEWPEQNAATAPVEEPVMGTDFDAHFDEAIAGVHMDFDLPAEPEALAIDAVSQPQPDFDVEDIDLDFHAEAPSAVDPLAAAFSLDMSEPEPAHEAVAMPVVEPVAAAPERSLEDELNALLGNMGARIAKPEGPNVASSLWASSAPVAPAADPFAVAAAGYGSVAASASVNASSAYAQPAIEPQGKGVADDVALDIDFDTADIDAFAAEVDPEPEPAAAMAQTASIFSRSWNRSTPVSQPQAAEPADQPHLAEEAHQPFADEPLFSAEAFEAELQQTFAAESHEIGEQEDQPIAAPYEDIPDVETVDVPERVVALADDLDLPEVAFEEDRPASAVFDDLDAEFAGLINELNDAPLPASPPRSTSYDDEPYNAGFGHGAAEAAIGAGALLHGMAGSTTAAPPASRASMRNEFDLPEADMRPFAPAESFDAEALDFDPEFDEAMTVPEPVMAAQAQQPRRRGLIAAAVVGAVAVIGGIGAFALSPGGSQNGAPVLVKADDTPIKVKPENPGGAVVPNQNNKVYEAVAKGIQPAAPEQQKLVVDEQQPVNVNTAAPQNNVAELPADEDADAAPLAKSEDRIDPNAQQAANGESDQQVALVSPRKVRTMIVKPDGTLAPREDAVPSAEVAATEPADPAPQRVVSAAPAEVDDQTGTVPSVAEASADTAAAVEKPVAAKPKADTQSPVTPQTVATVPQRPSDQPVDVVGEVKPDQVASISPTAAAPGSWSMQIASQPSAEAAQSTYKDLARRYAGVLEGQPVNIVQAEIAGKGTFYRVRVPANSRNDAIKLCENYKAAGGNCFVSK